MAKKLFRGQDRRIINKAVKCIDLARKRDLKAADTTKKSSIISTRTQMFDPTDATLHTALGVVYDHLTTIRDQDA